MAKSGPKPKYTPEERKERRKAQSRASHAKHYAVPENRAKVLVRNAVRRANMTPEERAATYSRSIGVPMEWAPGQTIAGMNEAQNGLCAICDREFGSKKNTHIDHCHVTGKVRGLLCFTCNTALGKFRDDPFVLLEAVKYLFRNHEY